MPIYILITIISHTFLEEIGQIHKGIWEKYELFEGEVCANPERVPFIMMNLLHTKIYQYQ